MLVLLLQVKKKMSADDFLKNNRGINDGQDLPAEFMRSLYDRIVNNEIKVSVGRDHGVVLPDALSAPSTGPA